LSACEHSTHTAEESPKSQGITNPRFRLYETQNIYTLLLLDTRTGRLWQTQYATDKKGFRGSLPIQIDALPNGGEDGRFTLTPTRNMWTFILADSEKGWLWQCQYAMNDKDRGCLPLDLVSKDIK